VYALLASPHATGLMSRAYSMSGSPRLNSTVPEAQRYWHRQVVNNTRCGSIGFGKQATGLLAACLRSLNSSELVASLPDNWHADGWSFGVFDPSWQYSPLLLIDGPGGVLPADYLSTFNGTYEPPSAGVPLIIGVTRQESDFSPGNDVRNLSRSEFSTFVASHFARAYGKQFVKELLPLYLDAPEWEPQKVYSEIITDATTLCPSRHLAHQIAVGRSQPVYLYGASQTMSTPPGFCVLQPFNGFNPPYCPMYSFHAVDMFALFQPYYDASRFNYTFSPTDRRFGQLIQERMMEFANNGTIASWPHFTNPDRQFRAIDLALPERIVPHFKYKQCEFWLGRNPANINFYDTIGLIN